MTRNLALWNLSLLRLMTIPDYQNGALLTIDGETRYYLHGKWWDESFHMLIQNIPTLTIDDLFPRRQEDAR